MSLTFSASIESLPLGVEECSLIDATLYESVVLKRCRLDIGVMSSAVNVVIDVSECDVPFLFILALAETPEVDG
jgi:hypothetical protein